MLFSETHDRKVVSTDTADTIGRLHSYVVDPAAQRIVALTLTKTPVDGTVLPWRDITGFGADAITAAGLHLLVEPDDELASLAAKAHTIVGKQVLTTAGCHIGTVADVDFEPTTGTITALLLGEQSIAGHRLIGAGSYAVIIAA